MSHKADQQLERWLGEALARQAGGPGFCWSAFDPRVGMVCARCVRLQSQPITMQAGPWGLLASKASIIGELQTNEQHWADTKQNREQPQKT